MRWRWLDRLRRPSAADDAELERHKRKTAKDWEQVREASRDLADLIENALKGDEGGARGHSR